MEIEQRAGMVNLKKTPTHSQQRLKLALALVLGLLRLLFSSADAVAAISSVSCSIGSETSAASTAGSAYFL